METKNKNVSTTRKIVALAMLAAMAYVLMLVSHVIPKVSGILQFDIKDIPIIMGGFVFGPLASVCVSVLVSALEMVTVSTTGPIGLLMNVIASSAIACTASLLYKRWQNIKGAVAGLVAGVLAMTAVMLLWNWLIAPIYMNVPRDMVVSMLIPVFLPFNLLKGGTNAALTLLLYKPLVHALRRMNLAPERHAGAAKHTFKMNIGVLIAALFVVASCILAVLIWVKVI